MIYGVIIFFGDSLTAGSRDEFGLSFPIEVGCELTKEMKQLWTTVNLGVPGETTADMLKRSYKEVRNYPEAKDIVLLAGTNDAMKNVSPDRFARNYACLLKDFAILKKRVFCCTIPLKTAFGSPGYEWKINDLIKKYNKKIRKVEYVIELEDLGEENFADGVHFNHEGNKEVARRVIKKIKEIR